MPIARFQMPDGRVARFEVPTGTTPDEATAMMKQHFAVATPAAPEEPKDPTLLGSLFSGVGAAAREFGQTGTTLAGGKPEAVEESANPAAQDMALGDVMHPKLLAEKALYGLGKGAPAIGGAVLGGVAGGLTGGIPGLIAGGTAGEMAGSGLVETAQTLGPYYATALQKNPNNPEAAFNLALAQATTEGAITGASFGLFKYAPKALRSEVGKIALQAFGIQPAISAAGQVAQGAISGEGVTGADLAKAYPQAVIGTAVPLVGTHLAGRAVDRFLPKREAPAAKETPSTPEDISTELTPEARASDEQAAQTAARERMALGAIDTGEWKGDEGFQPDIFASQLEQERRRVQPVSEGEAPIPETPAAPAAEEQPGLFGQHLSDTDELARMQAEEDLNNAKTAAEKQAAETKLAALKQASALETLSLKQGAEQPQASEANRRAVLLDTIQSVPTNNYNTLAANFSRALADQGFARVEPTEAELGTIKRAVDVQRAQPEVPPPAPPLQEIRTAPGGAAELEAQIPELTPPPAAPVQPSFEGMGRRGSVEPPAPEPIPVAQTITPELLDGLGVSPQAFIRKRVIGKDLNEPAVRQQFVDFANNQKVGQEARLNIARMLEGVPDEQMELFQPRRPAGEPRVTGREPSVSDVSRGADLERVAPEATGADRAGVEDAGAPAEPVGRGKAAEPSALELAPTHEDVAARANEAFTRGEITPFERSVFAELADKKLDTPENISAKLDERIAENKATEPTTMGEPLRATGRRPSKERVFTGENARAEADAALKARGPQGITAERAQEAGNRSYTKLMAEGMRGGERDPTLVAGTVGKDGVSTMDKFKAGESVQSLLRHVEENSKDPEARELARALRRTVPNDVTIRDMRPGEEIPPPDEVPEGYEGAKRPAYFDRNDKQVVFGSEHVEDTDRTLLHELVHAATETALERRTPAGKHIEEIFNRFQKAAPKDESYGFTAAHEFVAEALSNPEFRDTLKRMQDRGTSVWNRLVNTIRRVLGMPPLDYLKRILDPKDILRSAARETMETITRDSNGKEISRGPYDAQWNAVAKKAPQKIEEARTAIDKIAESRNPEALANNTGALTVKTRSAKQASSFLRKKYEEFRDAKARRTYLFTLPTEDVFRNAKALAGDRIKNIDALRTAFDGADMLRHRLIFAGSKISERLTAYQAKAKGNDFRNLENVVLGSTLEQVDLHETMPKDASRSVKELYDVWKTLPEPAQTLYKDIFDFFDGQKSEQLKYTLQNIKDSTLPDALKEQITKEVETQFGKLAKLKRYFPLSRPGKYWLRFGDGADHQMRKFETVGARNTARDQYIAKLRAAGDKRDIDTLFADKELATGDDMHSLRLELQDRPDTILNKVNKIIDKASNKNAKEEIADSVFQLYMDSMGGADVARHWAPRTGDSPIGFSTDINRVFSARAIAGAAHMSRLAYRNQISNIIGGMYEAARGRADSDYLMPFVDTMAARAARITDPITEATIWDSLAQNGNKAVWVWMLTSPKTAIINFVQVPVVAMPTMAAELKMPDGTSLGYTRASAALSKNLGIVFGVGNEAKIGAGFAAKKNSAAPRLGEALGNIYKAFEEEGRFSTTYASDMGSLARKPSAEYAKDSWSKVSKGTSTALNWMTSMFQLVESRSRQLVAMTTAEIEYTNAIKSKKFTHDEAVQIAKNSALKITNGAMFNYAQWNKSELLTGGSGHGASAASAKFATQFSSYSTFFTSYILRNAHTMFRGLDKAERKEAATKLFGTLGMTAMFGGVQGMGWLYGTTMGLLSAFGLTMNEDDDGDESNPLLHRNADAWFKKYFLPTYFGPGSGLAKTFGLDKKSADLLMSSIYSGPISALTGADFSPSVRIDLPFQKAIPLDSVFFADDAPDITDRNAFEDVIFHLASGPSGGLVTQMQSGISDFYKGDFLRGAEQMVPSLFRGPLRALRFATEGNLTRQGAEIKDREWFTTGMLLQQAAGFGITDLDELQRITFQLNTAAKEIEADRAKVYDKFDRALSSGNDKAYDNAMDDLNKFNEKNPLVPITGPEIRASLKSLATGRAGAISGVQPSKRYRGFTAEALSDESDDEE